MYPKISVIVPIYNAEKYIHRCVASVLGQTFGDFELLLINDGSTDNSLEICCDLSLKDKRIKVYSQSNGGPSKARNLGIKKAVGKYITFVDADDYVLENYLNAMIDEPESADFVITGYTNFYEVTQNEIDKLPGKNIYASKDPSQILGAIEYVESKYLLASPCCKLVRRSLLKDYDIWFDEELTYGEDHLFNLDIVTHISSIKIVNVSNYIYTHGSRASLTNRSIPWREFGCYIDKRYSKRLRVLDIDKNNNKYKHLIDSETVQYLWQLIHSLYYQEPDRRCRKQIIKDIIDSHSGIIFEKVNLPVSYKLLQLFNKYLPIGISDVLFRLVLLCK